MVLRGCGVIIIRNGMVLLMKRKNAKYFDGVWSNSGGKVNDEESLEEAAIRETKEELGIGVKIKKKIGDYKWLAKDGIKGIFTGFEAEIMSGKIRIVELHKCSEIKWFNLTNLPQQIAPYTAYYLKNLGY